MSIHNLGIKLNFRQNCLRRILVNENRAIVMIWVGIVAGIHGVLPLLEAFQRRIRISIHRQIHLRLDKILDWHEFKRMRQDIV